MPGKNFNAGLVRDLRKAGYDAVPVNPHVTEVDGVRCFDRVQAISPPVDGVLIMTPRNVTDTIAQDCVEAGVKRGVVPPHAQRPA